MDNHFRKTVLRLPFETVLAHLRSELYREGFEVSSVIDLQIPHSDAYGVSSRKYKLMVVYHPFLYSEMRRFSPFEGLILPCIISLIETYPGETGLVPYNPTESIVQGIQSPSLLNLATETTKRMTRAIQSMEKEQIGTPDLVTSWG
jgi:uncharacterized protein (DUF302 family)